MALWWSSMDANNWDLQAVVRLGCCPSFPSSTSIRDPFSSVGRDPFVVDLVEEVNPVPDPVQTQNVIHELEELCKPFISAGQTAAPAAPSPAPVVPPQPVQPVRQPPPANRAAGRKRKKQQKKVVCQVPADVHPSDMWAWRKYGQKPIKGSPYPRGYYRCSSSKVCTARKQVERSRTDPSMLIVTYTGEHNHPVPTHRNSLAGSTRNKYPQNLGSSSNEDKTEGLSPTTPLVGSTEEENEGGDEDQDDGATNSFGLVDMMGNFDDEMAFLDSEGFDDEGSDELVKRFFSDSWEVDSLSTAIGN